VFSFWKDLERNNNRDWFQAHKDRYGQAAQKEVRVAELDCGHAQVRLRAAGRLENGAGLESRDHTIPTGGARVPARFALRRTP